MAYVARMSFEGGREFEGHTADVDGGGGEKYKEAGPVVARILLSGQRRRCGE